MSVRVCYWDGSFGAWDQYEFGFTNTAHILCPHIRFTGYSG
ncbi:MAG TPA: hypothetical protein VE986_03515 [Hyphomicrobiales bacterium]|nr:hypothetical protein [Hyphomicrobiales bacterium]